MSPRRFDDFIGPCIHGRDPYERCDEQDDPEYGGCQNLPAHAAEILALRAELERTKAERDQAIQGERDRACERDQARAAIAWAMGGNGSDFRARRDGEGGYWWRIELGQRAGMRWNGADCEWPPISTPVKPPEGT